MAKITGRVEVLVNGEMLLNKAGAVASGIGISGQIPVERKPILGDSGVHGYVEEVVEARVAVTITDRDDISLSSLANILGNGTVIFRAAKGGKVYTMEGATCMGNLQLTAGEGETTIEFFGPFWVEGTYSI